MVVVATVALVTVVAFVSTVALVVEAVFWVVGEETVTNLLYFEITQPFLEEPYFIWYHVTPDESFLLLI